MLSLDGLNMNPNRNTRTRIAVVATDEDGNKTYFRSVGAAALHFKLSAARIKTCAITHMPIDGHTLEMVPASTVEEFLPAQVQRHGTKRERGVVVGVTLTKEMNRKLKAISLRTGIKHTKLIRSAIETMLKQYETDLDA